MYGTDENELYFLEYIFHEPSLIKQIKIPLECITDGLLRFTLESFIESYNKTQSISLPSIYQAIDLKPDKYTKEDVQRVVAYITEYADEISIKRELANGLKNFNNFQDQLFERYKLNELKQYSKDFNNGKISFNEYWDVARKIRDSLVESNNEYINVDEIAELVKTEKATIPLRFEKFSNRVKLQEHSLMVLSARTGIGKSGFALNLLEDLSKTYKCLYFNMEMTESSVYKRLVSIISSVPMSFLSKPQTPYQEEVINKAIKELGRRKIKIIHKGQTIQSIRKRIIEEQKDEHLIVFIDYVGLIGSTEKQKSLYELVTAVVKELRQISLDFNCTIILLAQINRTGDDDPQMKDLKESGELEQSATQVIILSGQPTEQDEQEIIVNIAKNREGKIGKTKFIYNRATQRFKEAF